MRDLSSSDSNFVDVCCHLLLWSSLFIFCAYVYPNYLRIEVDALHPLLFALQVWHQKVSDLTIFAAGVFSLSIFIPSLFMFFTIVFPEPYE